MRARACEPGIGCRLGWRFAFGAIPGRAQREPGIQWHLRSARLDPGSALRAVRDDVEKKGAVRDDKEGRVTKMRGMT